MSQPTAWICVTCGTQFPPAATTPDSCPVCEDERQYVGLDGQLWTTLEALNRDHSNTFTELEHGVVAIQTQPKFGIGQRAILIQTPQGNILWDCISLLDESTKQRVEELGGVQAMAISHPHYYASMIEWSHAFGNAPIYLHQSDHPWVMRSDETIQFWSGETYALLGGFQLIRIGGHFDGYQILHQPGVVFVGDLPQVCMDRKWVSFMYSYPNLIPLAKKDVNYIAGQMGRLDYDRLYGAFPHQNITQDAKAMVARSAMRYIEQIS